MIGDPREDIKEIMSEAMTAFVDREAEAGEAAELERLRGENVVLMEALKTCIPVLYGMMPGTGPHSWTGKEIRDIHNASVDAVEDAELSALYAAVITAAENTMRLWHKTENHKDTDFIMAWDALEDAVDALRAARGGGEG